MTDHVIITDDGPIRLIRLNRPAKKNALTDQMYETLAEALEWLWQGYKPAGN